MNDFKWYAGGRGASGYALTVEDENLCETFQCEDIFRNEANVEVRILTDSREDHMGVIGEGGRAEYDRGYSINELKELFSDYFLILGSRETGWRRIGN